ncbi:peptidylprolyl isomerase [Altererythrobacter sp. MF3-039]|uniref:peptidylprolyl isomerase n=1 Tax=Altererythrobacter sp. MF3-039 TaxID=3252901 RepID=UPI00390CB71A
MIKSVVPALAAISLVAVSAHAQDEVEKPTPYSVVQAAPQSDWVAIDPADLLVMTLAPDADGNDREVVIQLMPAPFSQGWTQNIRTLAKAHWWDGLSIYRSVDNWVVQWGDSEEDEADRTRPAKPLPKGLNVVPESEYTHNNHVRYNRSLDNLFRPRNDIFRWTGFNAGFPFAGQGTPDSVSNAPTHCYGSVGVARDLSPDTGTGAELYAVIGHAPRQLDRNIAVVGRVIEGMAHLSILPRGTGEYGVYETEAEHTPILSIRLGNEVKEPPFFKYLDTKSESFARYAAVSANRNDAFYKVSAGGIDICNLRVPIRRVPSD